MPRRAFYQLQAALVWQWFGHRNYDNRTAVFAWIITGLFVIILTLIGLFIRWLL